MRQNLDPEGLLVSLDEFVQQMHLLDKADNPKLVLKLVIRWTKAQPLLTKKLFQYILQSDQKISKGEEAIAVEQIIRNRLLKEFKQDELTLAIRKLLYKQDLENFLNKTNGKITNREQAYLINLQREFGLSNQQCQAIKNNNLLSKDSQQIHQKNQLLADKQAKSKNPKKNISPTKIVNKRSKASLSSLTNNHQRSTLINQTVVTENKQPTVGKIFQSKLLWLLIGGTVLSSPLLSLPLLSLFINGLGWSRNSQQTTTSNLSIQQQKLCVDVTSRQSPRMSLGEKILTQELNHLQPLSRISLYEGAAAFARCEFSAANNKFQKSLVVGKNNPEALIYLNNTTAITQKHLKIAVSVPLGSKPEIAWEILRGVAQAQAEINQQGGVRQKLLLIQIVNDDNNPEIVRQVAKQLAADKSILAVVGHNASNASLAAWEIYQKQGLVMISPTSSSTELSGVGSYILRTALSVAALANTLSDYASVNSLTKVAICFDSSSSASSSFIQEFIAEMTKDSSKIAAVKCDFAREDFNPKPIVEQAIAQDADALLLAPSVKQISQAIAVAQANQHRLPLLGNHSLYTFETIMKGKDAVAGMVLPSPWLPDTTPNHNFLQTARKYWGGDVNWRTATAHDATAAIIQGLQQSDTRSKLQSVLTQPDFLVNGATGKFYFDRGDHVGKVQLVYIQQSDRNSDEYKFSQLKPNSKIKN